MPTYNLYFYSWSDLGYSAGTTGFVSPVTNRTVTGAPSLMSINDDDALFQEASGPTTNSADTGTSQTLVSGFSVDGGPSFSAGAPVWSQASAKVVNLTTGQEGLVFVVGIGGSANGLQYGFVSTIPLGTGDVVSFTTRTDVSQGGGISFPPWDFLNDSIAYSALYSPPVLDGTVDGTSGNDVIAPGYIDAQGDQVDGTDGIHDRIMGNGGADSITAGAGNDTVFGGDGSDTLAGGAGNDVLYGGGGQDILSGGGADTLSGGDGSDRFGIDGSDTAGNIAMVVDGGTVETAGFIGDGLDLSDRTQNLTVNIGTNSEAGTIDGLDGDAGTDITFTEIETIELGSGNDTVNAGSATGPLNIGLGAGNDSIVSGAGNDSMDAGAGNDVVSSGAGDDNIWMDAGDDTFYGGSGDDTAWGWTGNDLMDGGSGNDLMEGGDGSDTLFGGAGNDVLDGGANDDDIVVGAGDTALGGAGDDVFTVDPTLSGTAAITVTGGETAEESVTDPSNNPSGRTGDVLDLTGRTIVSLTYNQADPSWNGTTAESGTVVYLNGEGQQVTINFSQIEHILRDAGPVDGTAGNDVMNPGYADAQGDQVDGADGNNDTIFGNGGNDSIAAGAGSDIVDGGADNDTVLGGTGNDTLSGDAGRDSLSGGDGNDSIDGGDGADTLLGNSGNDTLAGGMGNDSLLGGDGRDSADGGDGDDVINTRNTAAAPDSGFPGYGTVPFFPADANPDDDRDTVFGGAGHDTILTGDDADLVDGGTGNDSIDAGVDNDTVAGGDGDDTIVGGEGRDSLSGGAGADLIDGGDPALPQGDIADAAGDPATSNNSDTLSGGDGNDTLRGGDDADSLSGDAGDDSLDGGVDDDALSGGIGNDTLRGGQGNDALSGGDGRDVVDGGDGADTLQGGAGADIFIADGSADRIIDFDAVTGMDGTPGASSADNDFVDLSSFYNAASLAAWNAANPTRTFGNALEWLRADQSDDGILDAAGGLRLENQGAMVDAAALSAENTGVVCFVRGTRIMTAEGEREIETLAAGDLILTMDHGYQPIRWIGSTRVEAKGKLAPILFEAGVLGNARPLRVSPQHRMLLSGWEAELLYGEFEVLVAAKMLINDQSIRREEGGIVEYFHMLFDVHEIVFAEGTPSESFHPGQQGWGALAEEARAEILTLFPMLDADNFTVYGTTCRRCLSQREAHLASELIVKPPVWA